MLATGLEADLGPIFLVWLGYSSFLTILVRYEMLRYKRAFGAKPCSRPARWGGPSQSPLSLVYYIGIMLLTPFRIVNSLPGDRNACDE